MRLTALVGGVAGALVLTGCGTGDDGADATEDAGPHTLTVYAAASLTDSMERIATQFEAAQEEAGNPGVTVELNVGGSSDLLAQLRSGAPADVFASADETTMGRAAADALLEKEPELFATNVLQIATPPDNPAGIGSLADLADSENQVVLCAPEVPCGAAAERVQQAAGTDIEPVSEERVVTDVLGKVSSGEADAGLVYVTDVLGAGDDVLGIDFPESAEAVNNYPIAALADSEQDGLAQAFVDFVVGESGQQILADAGFGAPDT
ncbi:molybdate ABC transporter substrate-binding protein [Aeromicrobium sp. CTD01-1L150]|uniref:molybdate ABC transporter substrate-binding protein n=1 Tax=Aeromicrobium sp. CTD01-1L150 TaxID=3341830 RepID=UPI0035C03451